MIDGSSNKTTDLDIMQWVSGIAAVLQMLRCYCMEGLRSDCEEEQSNETF